MISLIHYDEFGKDMGFPSIVDSFSDERYEGQNEVIEYLKSGKDTAVSMGRRYDVITGAEIEHETLFMNDGEYRWTSTLIYYVEKYNLKLPDKFIRYVLSQNS